MGRGFSAFFLPVRILSRVFRGRFTDELKQLFLQNKLQFHIRRASGFLQTALSKLSPGGSLAQIHASWPGQS